MHKSKVSPTAYIKLSCDAFKLSLKMKRYTEVGCLYMHMPQRVFLSLCVCARWDMNVKLDERAFSGVLCGCASGRSSASARVGRHNVPVSPRDIPKERGKRQPPPTLPIHHHDTTSCSHGKPPLASRSGPGRGGGRGVRDLPSIKNTLFCLL